jgi:hypothetical protein
MRRQLQRFSRELKRLRKQEVHRFRRELEETCKDGETERKVRKILRDGIKQWINGVLR